MRAKPAILLTAGALAVLVGLGAAVSTARFVHDSTRVDGVALASPRGDRHPLIRVKLPDSRTLTRELGGFSSYPPGTAATVLYDPDDPAAMQIDSAIDLWAPSGMSLVVGAGLVLTALSLGRQQE